jgi:predicted GNAT family acetyltransferase
MALVMRHVLDGVWITGVHTPQEKRRQGYATSCVAQLSAKYLAEGASYCFLFTDLANPTSNSIYEKIGYERVCDFQNYNFGA